MHAIYVACMTNADTKHAREREEEEEEKEDMHQMLQ